LLAAQLLSKPNAFVTLNNSGSKNPDRRWKEEMKRNEGVAAVMQIKGGGCREGGKG